MSMKNSNDTIWNSTAVCGYLNLKQERLVREQLWAPYIQGNVHSVCTKDGKYFVKLRILSLRLTHHYFFNIIQLTYHISPFKVLRSLCVPHSGHCMYRTVVTMCNISSTVNYSSFCPHSVFMCFVWIWEQTAIISLYSIDWLVFITDNWNGVWLLRGTSWVFK
jgi:hypothetical protein